MSRDKHRWIGSICSPRRLAAVGVAILLLPACSGGDGAADADSQAGSGEGMTLAISLPYSGESAFVGENVGGRGATLAVQMANDAAGVLGEDVSLVQEDTERRTAPGLAAVNALIAREVTAGIGPTSAEVPALRDVIEDSGIPWVFTASIPELDEGLADTNIFRILPSDTTMIPAMLSLGMEEGARVATVFENNAIGQQQRETVLEAIGARDDVEATGDLLLAPAQTTGYQTEVTDLFSNEHDSVLWQLQDVSAAAFFQNVQQLGELEGQTFIGTDGAIAEATVEILQPYVGQATFLAVSPASLGPGAEEFEQLYREQFDEDPAVLADAGYDAANVLMLAVVAAETTDSEAVGEEVNSVSGPPGQVCTTFEECADLLAEGEDINYEGATNTLDFNEEHNIIAPYGIFEITADGSVEEIGTISEEEVAQFITGD